MNESVEICVMDCNNFWSPSGGGVRRYHLEKLAFFKGVPVPYVFVMQDERDFTEEINETTWIEHVRAPKFRGNWDYRFLFRVAPLRRAIEKYQPDVIEVGSPYLMPWLVRWAVRGFRKRPALVSFWHADFPVTYVKRYLQKWNGALANIGELLAWFYARLSFKSFDGFLVSSQTIGSRMEKRGLHPIHWTPLGVDVNLYHPDKKDLQLVSELKDGMEGRLTIFFPHRFAEEKGLRTLLKAYPQLCEALGHEPALVFAGTGPSLSLVKEAASQYKHVHYLGFLKDSREMARYYASCEMGLALSGHETFGLSILESMASGQVLIGANSGAAMEHIQNSGAGFSVPIGNPEALIKGVVELQKKDRRTLSQKARDYARQFTWEKCFQRELDTYRSILQVKHGEGSQRGSR